MFLLILPGTSSSDETAAGFPAAVMFIGGKP
jgi:hypothetical protein